jgi:SAM-dependent methyltransferase
MSEQDYVLGTEADEIERLGIQHEVWRERVREAWARAGICAGQTVLDVGAGPGWASADLAELVGPEGRVIALERSPSFAAALRSRGLPNVEVREQDVAEGDFGAAFADASWCRWVLSFVTAPERTVGHIARALKPGGVAVFHEYADYGAWRLMPPDRDHERFREAVIRSWRDAGGEPDVALHLPRWLEAEGLELVEVRPHIMIVGRGDPAWQWPASFMGTNARRLAQLGYVDEREVEPLATIFDRAPASARIITPLVAEVIARKP